MIRKLFLDNTKCTGCSLCEMVCSMLNFKVNNPKKAAIQIRRKFPEPGNFEILVCNQCGHCQEVCQTGAIYKKDGILRIDPEKCTFCKLCVGECPANALFTHKDLSYPTKCSLCGECISVCTSGAIQWSD